MSEGKMKKHWIRGIKFLLFIAVIIPVIGFVAMSLWNWLMPAIFGLRMINFWQALGLMVLSRILLGGFRGRPGGGHWRGRMMARVAQMTPEEREKFFQGIRHGAGPKYESFE